PRTPADSPTFHHPREEQAKPANPCVPRQSLRTRSQAMSLSSSCQRIYSVARKEVLHILRDRQTLLMTLFIPILELLMLGHAIGTNARRIPTVVMDQARNQESRELLAKFENSDDFFFVGEAFSDQELTDWIVRGKARVGVKIPENYSRRMGPDDQGLQAGKF